MCGIAGIISFKRYVDASEIKLMADALRHRGPDDEGYFAINFKENKGYPLVGDESKWEGAHLNSFNKEANMFFAHRRLSIIDLSPAGHQPMATDDGKIWIVYNGEIYNYIELREELRSSGYRFKTNTDTEVVLASYERWGKECIHRFNGMWAFVIYDQRNNIVFGSRDRFGVKPLYYFFDGIHFAFASEVKALLKFSQIKKRVNPVAVFDYLALGREDRQEETFFKSVFELSPAHSFELNLKTSDLNKWKYYALNSNGAWEGFEERKLKDHVNNIRELTVKAVKLRLRSDVPVGSCLSGGIDSSSIVCVISGLLKKEDIPHISKRQSTFTASYNNEILDESRWAQIVVNATGASWHRTYPNAQQLIADLEDLVYAQDMPFGSTSVYAQFRVMKLVQETGVKVLLDGQGGDELFAGYFPFYGTFFAETLRNLDIARLVAESKGLKNSPTTAKSLAVSLLKLYARRVFPDRMNSFLFGAVSKKVKYISRDFWKKYSGGFGTANEMAVSLNHDLCKHMGSHFLKPLLRFEDRNSMRFSIEARTPFADDIDLIDYTFRVPSVYKIHDGWSKYLLREAMKDFLPAQIKNRRDKIGGATPENHWLIEVKERLRPYLSQGLGEFVDIKKAIEGLDGLSMERSQYALSYTDIWRVVNLGVWMKVFGL
jgi:asparagine synthase (glutamine-hydrolysing)